MDCDLFSLCFASAETSDGGQVGSRTANRPPEYQMAQVEDLWSGAESLLNYWLPCWSCSLTGMIKARLEQIYALVTSASSSEWHVDVAGCRPCLWSVLNTAFQSDAIAHRAIYYALCVGHLDHQLPLGSWLDGVPRSAHTQTARFTPLVLTNGVRAIGWDIHCRKHSVSPIRVVYAVLSSRAQTTLRGSSPFI